jgi:hypothetical protein
MPIPNVSDPLTNAWHKSLPDVPSRFFGSSSSDSWGELLVDSSRCRTLSGNPSVHIAWKYCQKGWASRSSRGLVVTYACHQRAHPSCALFYPSGSPLRDELAGCAPASGQGRFRSTSTCWRIVMRTIDVEGGEGVDVDVDGECHEETM